MFDLNQASEGSVQVNYQKTGIFDNVTVSEVVLEKTAANNVPYMRLVTKGADGAIGSSSRMFLSTEVREGKKTSAWSITARNIVDLIKATHNVDDDTAKGMITNINSQEALVQKVSALLVGKPFRAKFKGVTSSKGLIYAELGQAESMRTTPTNMKFNVERDIKPYEGTVVVTSKENVGSTSSIDDLPF